MTEGAARWQLAGLTVGFAGRPVVRDIDLQVTAGDLIAVTGVNGAGKSCLLRTLAGELPPLMGAIHAPPWFTAAGLGLVAQVAGPDPRLPITLAEMVTLGLAGLPVGDGRARLSEALALVGLAHRAAQSWQGSSGGERQRALIARALIRRPAVLLLDEATSHLDGATADALFANLGERCAAGQLTVVAAIHDDELVRSHATRRLHLADGRAQADVMP